MSIKLSKQRIIMSEIPNNNRPFIRSTISAGLAAIGASLCCLGPLVLISLGIGGAWMSYLTALEPYQPIFVVVALGFLFMAFRQLYLVPRQCAEGDSCALPSTQRNQRIIFWLVTIILIALLTFPYYGMIFFE